VEQPPPVPQLEQPPLPPARPQPGSPQPPCSPSAGAGGSARASSRTSRPCGPPRASAKGPCSPPAQRRSSATAPRPPTPPAPAGPAAARLPAAAVFALGGGGRQREVLQQDVEAVRAAQGLGEGTVFALGPAQVLDHGAAAVEQHLDVEQLQRQPRLGGQAPAFLEEPVRQLPQPPRLGLVSLRGAADEPADPRGRQQP